ncbi:hypothetical protein [Luteococcus sp.]|uniref:hypothetical protein n=1 Tax=Luteococcus sp. TaxID=1969402 RepID=UPI003734D1B8
MTAVDAAGDRMVPLLVTARMATGVVTAHPWGIALDGILAAQLWAQIVDTTPADQVAWPSTTPVPPDLDLPVARCTVAGADLWHWASTCSHASLVETQVGYRYQPAPGALMESYTAAMPASINPGTRWSRREVPHLARVTQELTWRAVGDPTRIRSLLEPVTAIGKGRHHGEGRVLSWTVTEHPDADPWAYSHLHITGHLGRPTPPACLPDDLVANHPPMLAGLRPPAMHPSRQHHLCTPTP